MNTPKKTLADELDRIAARYESQFAGMPRSSRNVDELDAITEETRSLLGRIESIPDAVRPPELNELATTARQNIALYQRERALIHDAALVGPEFERFAILASSANFVFARYRRHFAGQSRATRDVSLLTEMVDDLETIEEAMRAIVDEGKDPQRKSELGRDRDLVRQSFASYRSEIEHIAGARTMGTPDERASLLAQLANDQFRVYQNHFAGKSRATRRPALLVRVVEALEGLGKAMRGLKKAGLVSESNDANIDIVERQVATYKTELDEIRTARKGIAFGDLLGRLGGGANEVFEAFRNEFAGKDRKSRDLARLSALCDELGDVRKQMLDLGRAEPSASNDANVDIVTTQLANFEQEHEQIALAQKK
jgi:hypothetical protein